MPFGAVASERFSVCLVNTEGLLSSVPALSAESDDSAFAGAWPMPFLTVDEFLPLALLLCPLLDDSFLALLDF